jgi:TPR repeat protein
MKRIKADDPVALFNMGTKCDNEGNYEEAFKYFTKAADLGYMNAHFNLSIMYKKGEGVEKDLKKKIYHLEEAAIGGHPEARYNLGCIDGNNGMPNRAVKHWIIAAKLGYDKALEAISDYFSHGVASKEDFEAALRGHQAAVDATKSEQRDAAEKHYQQIRW